MDHPANPAVTTGLKWSGCTDRGKVRPNNEDAFLAVTFDAREVHRLGKIGTASTEQNDFAFAVSDGMGGANAGELASRITVEKITTLLPRSFQQRATGLAPGFSDVLPELFTQIHKALVFVGDAYDECRGMEATLSLCWFTPTWMYFGHAGDSRIYYLPAGADRIKPLSEDDTHVGWLFRNGKINEREARTHPRRSVLQKSLGGGNQFVDPQVGAVGYLPGDLFLICSDGLVDGLYDQGIVDLLRAPAKDPAPPGPAQTLVAAAVRSSGRDNTTAVVIEAV